MSRRPGEQRPAYSSLRGSRRRQLRRIEVSRFAEALSPLDLARRQTDVEGWLLRGEIASLLIAPGRRGAYIALVFALRGRFIETLAFLDKLFPQTGN